MCKEGWIEASDALQLQHAFSVVLLSFPHVQVKAMTREEIIDLMESRPGAVEAAIAGAPPPPDAGSIDWTQADFSVLGADFIAAHMDEAEAELARRARERETIKRREHDELLARLRARDEAAQAQAHADPFAPPPNPIVPPAGR